MSSSITRVPRRRYQARQDEITAGRTVGWLLVLSSMFWPRAGIIAFWIFGDELSTAFGSWILPFVGFFVLPWTTVTYAIMWSVDSNGVLGWEWILVGLAFVLDVATWLGARHLARS